MADLRRRVIAALSGLAQAKVVLALVLVATGAVTVRGMEFLRVLLVLILLASSILLSVASGDAAKSRALGRLMSFLGAGLSLRIVLGWENVAIWRAIHPEAFMFAAVLDFASAFPAARVGLVLVRVGIAWGVFDFLARLGLGIGSWFGSEQAQFLLEEVPVWDWMPTYLLSLLAMFPILRAMGDSKGADHRQLKVFVYGLAIGIMPFVLILPAFALVPSFSNWLVRPEIQPYFVALTYPFLFVFPITATYAVWYKGALDYRSALRSAARYALARYTLLALIAIPFGAGVVLLYANREEPLARLLSGWRFLALAGVASAAAAAFPLRHRLLAVLDRRYFREAHDARLVLLQLTEAVRRTRDINELSVLLVEQVDAALHVESVALLMTNPEQPGVFRTSASIGDVQPDPVSGTSQIVSLLAGSPEPLPIAPGATGSLIGRLPETEREWLRNAGLALLVPLLGSGEALMGLLALGRRKSEMPFSKEDCDLLSAVGATAGLALESRVLRLSPTPGGGGVTPPRDTAPLGQECRTCLKVFEATSLSCPLCRSSTEPALLPRTVLDKYRLESRLGAGGFGVVYAATEVRLGRRVALKTLPRFTRAKVERFKREALAAAAIQHPNLAMIHTAENWNETPILVFELLEGGTLAQRLAGGRLSVAEALRLGGAMAGVLEEAHRRGILHRDIKPSNIGYDARQVPKLLDFGLARFREPSMPDSADILDGLTPERIEPTLQDAPPSTVGVLTERGEIVGTPSYLPLEAYRNARPGPAFDLWALSVTLYEGLSGANPFRASTQTETIERLERETPVPLRDLRSDCPPELSDLLARALSRDRSERPATAREFKAALHRIEGAPPS